MGPSAFSVQATSATTLLFNLVCAMDQNFLGIDWLIGQYWSISLLYKDRGCEIIDYFRELQWISYINIYYHACIKEV